MPRGRCQQCGKIKSGVTEFNAGGGQDSDFSKSRALEEKVRRACTEEDGSPVQGIPRICPECARRFV